MADGGERHTRGWDLIETFAKTHIKVNYAKYKLVN